VKGEKWGKKEEGTRSGASVLQSHARFFYQPDVLPCVKSERVYNDWYSVRFLQIQSAKRDQKEKCKRAPRCSDSSLEDSGGGKKARCGKLAGLRKKKKITKIPDHCLADPNARTQKSNRSNWGCKPRKRGSKVVTMNRRRMDLLQGPPPRNDRGGTFNTEKGLRGEEFPSSDGSVREHVAGCGSPLH